MSRGNRGEEFEVRDRRGPNSAAQFEIAEGKKDPAKRWEADRPSAKDRKKRKKILLLIFAAVLVAAIAVGSILGVILSNDFRVGKMNRIEIGMTKREVKKKLGVPHEANDSVWAYYSEDYKKLVEEENDLEISILTIDNANELDVVSKRLAEVKEARAYLTHDEIKITYSYDTVAAVEMRIDKNNMRRDEKIAVKKARLDDIKRCSFPETHYAVVEYQNGSYRHAPVRFVTPPQTIALGETTAEFYDEWSDSAIAAKINVVKDEEHPMDDTEIVPDGSEGYRVVVEGREEIGDAFFPDAFRSKITSLTIGGNKSIGNDAFRDFDNLQSATIKFGVTRIGENAFYRCRNLQSVEISDSVTMIGSNAFYQCGSLRNLTLGNGVKRIGNKAFAECSKLESIVIPDSVQTIDSHAFFECKALRNVTLGRGVRNIGYGGLGSCDNLETIAVKQGNAAYYDQDNCIIETGTSTLVLGCKSSVIPTDGSVTKIGDGAFFGCVGLVSVEIPDTVVSIGGGAYEQCLGLRSVTLGRGVRNLDASAFNLCGNLETIAVKEGNAVYSDQGICLIETKTSTLVLGCKTSVIPTDGSVTRIGDSAFFGRNLERIVIPESVVSIGDNAFVFCIDLKSIEIPVGVTEIGEYALTGCFMLESIVFRGTTWQWNAMKKGEAWNSSTGEYTVICTDGMIPKS